MPELSQSHPPNLKSTGSYLKLLYDVQAPYLKSTNESSHFLERNLILTSGICDLILWVIITQGRPRPQLPTENMFQLIDFT